MIISVNVKKASYENKHPSIIKKKNSLESTHRRNLPQHKKGHIQASLMAQMVKNLPTRQETRV